jgi:hypothetical protein
VTSATSSDRNKRRFDIGSEAGEDLRSKWEGTKKQKSFASKNTLEELTIWRINVGEGVRNKKKASWSVLYHMYVFWNISDEISEGKENVSAYKINAWN